jgi:hypothetical protein
MAIRGFTFGFRSTLYQNAKQRPMMTVEEKKMRNTISFGIM